MGTSRVASQGQKELTLKYRGPVEGRRWPSEGFRGRCKQTGGCGHKEEVGSSRWRRRQTKSPERNSGSLAAGNKLCFWGSIS